MFGTEKEEDFKETWENRDQANDANWERVAQYVSRRLESRAITIKSLRAQFCYILRAFEKISSETTVSTMKHNELPQKFSPETNIFLAGIAVGVTTLESQNPWNFDDVSDICYWINCSPLLEEFGGISPDQTAVVVESLEMLLAPGDISQSINGGLVGKRPSSENLSSPPNTRASKKLRS